MGERRGGSVGPSIPGFDLADELGRGGFGVVYRAHQHGLERAVAIKVLDAPSVDEDARRRFERECRVLGALSDHPHIVTVHGSGVTDDGRLYLVLQYLEQGSYADRIRRYGPLAWEKVLAVGIKLSGALETAHAAGVLHRDVKPENVLVTDYGDPALADFGIARVAGGTQTRSGVITASLSHAAPEVLGGEDPTVASDVYGLGSALYALLAGQGPFDDAAQGGVAQLIGRVVNQPVPDLRARGVPDEVAQVLEAALAKDPADRPGSALALAEALRDAEGVLGRTPTPVVVRARDASEAVGAREEGTSATEDETRVAPSGDATRGAPPEDQTRVKPREELTPEALGGRDDGPRFRLWPRQTSWRVGLVVVALLVAGAIGLTQLGGDGGGPADASGADDRVLFTVADGDGPEELVTDGEALYAASPGALAAYDPSSGVTRWEAGIELAGEPGAGRLATTADVVVVAETGRLVGFHAASGEQRWTHATEGTAPMWPFVDADGALYAYGETELEALDPRDGSVVWRLDGHFPQPLLVRGNPGALHVQVRDELLALDPGTGEPRWALPLGGSLASVAAGNDRVYVAVATNDEQLGFTGVDTATGEVAWNRFYTTPSARTAQVFHDPGGALVLFDGDVLRGIDGNSGDPGWEQALGDPGAVLTSESGVLSAVWLPPGPCERANCDLPALRLIGMYDGESFCEGAAPVPAGSAVLDSRLYLPGDGGVLHAISPETCETDWSWRAPSGALRTGLTIATDLSHGFVVDGDGTLVGLRLWDQ